MTRMKKLQVVMLLLAFCSFGAMLTVILLAEYGRVTGHSASFESCEQCGAVRVYRTVTRMNRFVDSDGWEAIYSTKDYSSCDHKWRSGGRPEGVAIKPGNVLLLRNNDTYGAIIFGGYDEDKEEGGLPYRLVYRQDGIGTLDPTDTNVIEEMGVSIFQITSNYGTDGTEYPPEVSLSPDGASELVPFRRINLQSFGPFDLKYDRVANNDGSFMHYVIWFYRYPLEPVTEQDFAICATEETSFKDLDASDPRWVYRASSVDQRYEQRSTGSANPAPE